MTPRESRGESTRAGQGRGCYLLGEGGVFMPGWEREGDIYTHTCTNTHTQIHTLTHSNTHTLTKKHVETHSDIYMAIVLSSALSPVRSWMIIYCTVHHLTLISAAPQRLELSQSGVLCLCYNWKRRVTVLYVRRAEWFSLSLWLDLSSLCFYCIFLCGCSPNMHHWSIEVFPARGLISQSTAKVYPTVFTALISHGEKGIMGVVCVCGHYTVIGYPPLGGVGLRFAYGTQTNRAGL